MSQIEFLKYHGCGNNFVIVLQSQLDGAQLGESKWPELARKLCQRQLSIGADGLLIVKPGDNDNTFAVSMFNPDGSVMGMCGNGARCVAHAARANSWFTGSSCNLMIAGRKVGCCFLSEDLIEVDLGEVHVDLEKRTIELGTKSYSGFVASVGNPHFVIFDTNIDRIDLPTIGPAIETDRLFPDRTNVEFAQIGSKQRIQLRVWERGAGITLACGSGAAATQAVANQCGFTDDFATVSMPGGDLGVRLKSGHAYLSGPANYVFSGTIEV